MRTTSDVFFIARQFFNTQGSRQRNHIEMEKFRDDQWSAQMEGWATFAKHAQAMNNNMLRTRHSSSASVSSFSVSTLDSPSLSAQSEASSIAGKYMLQSPDLWHEEGFRGIAVFNPDTKRSKSRSTGNVEGEFTKTDKQQDWMLLQDKDLLFENIHHASDLDDGSGPLNNNIEYLVKDKERLVKSPVGLVHGTESLSNKSWLSDGTESWASASSQELSWNSLCDGASDVQPSILHETLKSLPTEDSICFHDSVVGISRQDERDRGTTRHPFAVNQRDENALGSKDKLYDQAKDGGIASCGEEGCMYESQALHSRCQDICNVTSASVLAPPSNIHMLEAQCHGAPSTSMSCAVGLETCFSAENNLDLNMLSKSQVPYVNWRKHANFIVEGPPEMPGQVGSGHQPFKCGSLSAESMAKQLPADEHDLVVSTLTNIEGSAYVKSASHNKPVHMISRHSAAVEDKFPSSSLHGYFRFVDQDGSPCYIFSVNDSDEVFFARACKPENESNKEDSNCLYTFHSRKDCGKAAGGWKNLLKLASSLVGKLKAFDSQRIDCKRSESICIEEVHFVLYGDKCQQPAESEALKNHQISAHHASKLLKPVSGSKSKFSMPTFGSYSQNFKQRDDSHIAMPDASVSQGLLKPHLHEPISREKASKRGSGDLETLKVAPCLKHSMVEQDRMHMELAAIAVTTSVKEHAVNRKKAYESSHKEQTGWCATFLEEGSEKGWGLGFLKKSSEIDSKLKRAVPLEEDPQRRLNETTKGTCESDMEKIRDHTNSAQTYRKPCLILNENLSPRSTRSKPKQPKMAVDVVVILPVGQHGVLRNDGDGPTEDGGSCGPTPLLERWQSGGNCDCGGWDMGCGLSILKAEFLKLHKRRATIALTSRNRIDWISPKKPLKIFTQGYKRKKLLMLQIIQAGLYSLSFQARFSPLQAFATAVAVFHQQITHK